MDAAVAGIIGAAAGAVLSGGLTVTGVVLTQNRADRREDERWRREREHERQVWAREEATRTYDQRRDAYLDFMKDWDERFNAIYMNKLTREEPEPPEDYLEPLFKHVEQVRTFGSRQAGSLALDAFGALRYHAYEGGPIPALGLDEFREQVRRDLGVADGSITRDGPTPGTTGVGSSATK
jgi:hypothetical protein